MSHLVNNGDKNGIIEYDSILQSLKEERVFDISWHGKETGGADLFKICERCDEYFRVYLTPYQLLTLAEVIKNLAESVINASKTP